LCKITLNVSTLWKIDPSHSLVILWQFQINREKQKLQN